jgi:hypothetical protein
MSMYRSDSAAVAYAATAVRSGLSSLSRVTSFQLLRALDRRLVIDLNLRLMGPKIKLPGAGKEGSRFDVSALYIDLGELR